MSSSTDANTEKKSPLKVEPPHQSLRQIDRDLPPWQQIERLCRQHGVYNVPHRLRDELVGFLMWARYGEALALSEAEEAQPRPAPNTEVVVKAEPVAWPLGEALKFAEAYIEEYEFDDGDQVFHSPSATERLVMLDMINGLFSEDEFVKALASPPSPAQVTVSRDDLAEIISKAGAPPGPPDGPIGALPDGHFLKVQAYKQADAVIEHLASPAREVTEKQIIAVARLYGNYIDGHGWTGFGPSPEGIEAALTSPLQDQTSKGE